MFQLGKLQYHLGQLYVKYNWPIWYPLFRLKKNRPLQKIKRRMTPVYLEQLDLGEISTWSVEQQQAARKLLCDLF